MNKKIEEIWSVLTRTLPEKNQALLEKEARGEGYPILSVPKKGDLWTLPCGTVYRWTIDNPGVHYYSERICEVCGNNTFEDVDCCFIACKKCGEKHFYDDFHRAYEEAQLRDILAKARGEKIFRVPALDKSSFQKWLPAEIAEAIILYLQPSPMSGEIRKEFVAEKSKMDSLLGSNDALGELTKELASFDCLALMSPSKVLIYKRNNYDLYIERLNDDIFALWLFFTDSDIQTPLVILDSQK